MAMPAGCWSQHPGKRNGQHLPKRQRGACRERPAGRATSNGDPVPLDRSRLITPLALCSADTAGKETQGLEKRAGDNSQVGFSKPLLAAVQGAAGTPKAASLGCLP